jgi:hypothetical protein
MFHDDRGEQFANQAMTGIFGIIKTTWTMIFDKAPHLG